jgi:thymidylate synthase
MNTLDKQYTDLLQDILDNGVTKQDRTGTGTISVFGRQIRHKMPDGFPLLTTKKMPFRLIATELIWFLRGDTNIKFLVDNDCHIWDGDAFKNYLNTYKGNFEMDKEEFIEAIKTNPEFAQKWGDLGPVYGRQWRSWETDDLEAPRYEHWKKDIDQIANLINDLKTNPDSRRLMVNAWNVGELDQMTLPPCHFGFQVYTRELSLVERMGGSQEKVLEFYKTITDNEFETYELNDGMNMDMTSLLNNRNIPTRAISLMWNQRSVDTFLGLPFNIASYGLLLEIIAKSVNMVPDELIGNLGDTHLYLDHLEQAKEQLNREPYPLPTLKHMKTDEFYKALSEDASLFTHLDPTDFQVENYQAHPHIKAPLSN